MSHPLTPLARYHPLYLTIARTSWTSEAGHLVTQNPHKFDLRESEHGVGLQLNREQRGHGLVGTQRHAGLVPMVYSVSATEFVLHVASTEGTPLCGSVAEAFCSVTLHGAACLVCKAFAALNELRVQVVRQC